MGDHLLVTWSLVAVVITRIAGVRVVKWIQLLVTGITTGSIYALIALGYVTIYRTSRIVNLAQGAFVMFGALFTYSFLDEVGLPYWLSAILGLCAWWS